MRDRVGRLAVVILGMALFVRSLAGSFVVDDHAVLRDHPAVTAAFSVRGIFLRDFWGGPLGQGIGVYRPVTTLSLWIDWHLGGGAPLWFHATNVALFGAILWVADVFLLRWAREDLSPVARWLAVAAFAAMTIHVDVVPSVVGRAELLAALFSLLAIDVAANARPTLPAAARMISFLLLAMLSKESALPMPLLCAWLSVRREPRARRAWAMASAAISALVAMIAWRASHGLLRANRPDWILENPLIGQPISVRLRGALEVLARYVEHVFAPIDLCPDYGYAAFAPDLLRAIGGGVLLAAALVAFGLSLRRRPRLADALAAFGASYVAVSHLLVAGSAIMADRLFFFPSFWLVVVIALAVSGAARTSPQRARLVAIGAAVLIALQAVMTALLVHTRRDQTTLSSYGVRACPNVARIRLYRADAAHETKEPFEAAWSMLVASAIEARFPAPVSESDFPAAWEDEPIERRLQLLHGRLGDDAFRQAARAARRRATAKGAAHAAVVLGAWSGPP